ncbi:hypothetical protein JTB14_015461 [Gonioctena quinquepunctata]|nr:hypothetical protein JTB14_015461 [Gonioctena quinquepunctata]
MIINKEKTKTMMIGKKHQQHRIHIEEAYLEQVTKFKFLGSVISEEEEYKRNKKLLTAGGRLFKDGSKTNSEHYTQTKLSLDLRSIEEKMEGQLRGKAVEKNTKKLKVIKLPTPERILGCKELNKTTKLHIR